MDNTKNKVQDWQECRECGEMFDCKTADEWGYDPITGDYVCELCTAK